MRFVEDFGLNNLMGKGEVLDIYRNVVSHRIKLNTFSPPKERIPPHPMANKGVVKGGRARSPIKSNNKLSSSPAFKPVGNFSIVTRQREQEFRERSGSVLKDSLVGIHGTVDQLLRFKHGGSGGDFTVSGVERSAYTPSGLSGLGGGTHAPHSGELVEVPSRNAGFCEFIEILCGIAMEGMGKNVHYSKMYPKPFDKVCALLCVWGIADCTVVEEAKFMWPFDKKSPQKLSKVKAWQHHDNQ